MQQWGRDLEAETAAARTGFGTARGFPVASRPPHLGLAEHALWWTPGAVCLKVGHCQYTVQQVGDSPSRVCVHVGMRVSTVL